MLTAYNGQTLTYDAIGNPLTWRDGMTMTWQDGRRLASLQTNGKNIQYTYDADGLRVTKTVDGTKHTYQYVGGLLMYETRGDISFSYDYDSYGHLSCIHYMWANGSSWKFYVACNSRGDVTAIYAADGTLRAKYTYDSWGNTLSIIDRYGNNIVALGDTSTAADNIGALNRIRYRGYYYDNESGLYYLQSRYYDPQVKRFLNADGYVSTGQGLLGTNMFAYCGNNPVNLADLTGKLWEFASFGTQLAEHIFGFFEEMEKFKSKVEAFVEERLAVAQTIYGEEHGYRTSYGEEKARKGQEGVATTIKNRYLSGEGSLTEIVNKSYSGYAKGKLEYENGTIYQPAWDYAFELANYLCRGDYNKIPANGLTTHTQFRSNGTFAKRYNEATGMFRRTNGEEAIVWEIVVLGGNTFFIY